MIKGTQNSPVKIDRFLPYPEEMPPLESFDWIDVNISGGNDSTAALLYMLYGYNVPKEKVTLFHARVDGPPENEVFFDWPSTQSHLEYLSRHFGDLPLVVAWDEKGFETRIRERGMFPDSSARYCTSYLKRDVYLKYARTRSKGNILCVTGERHEESSRRAGYPCWQVNSATAETKGRYVYNFRPILHLKKFEVSELIRSAGVKEHEAYQWTSRVSCRWCIFASSEELSAVAKLFPDAWERLKNLETSIGHTMKYQKGKRIPLCEFIHEDSEFEQLLLK
ncbi:phosphoadenosine phosphosulfate reductase family protein [Paenibacillus allorhizosphaerae]|uniref:Phosphoadenosine phosphosulphate reductase domain-containing protein n=1 Tax=Paenibacillus allorhizosphaerae TaxID=2849866 RepID=A0ABN7TQG3_9BACL|nr:phosphoadenosine phosphosulfate reductase family protein [Paenibacillus allorhizosphaerae]CAG7651371.1 hypothetical protein PAECIP111802_04946 [Paenibacillus allorhizosphaerae]